MTAPPHDHAAGKPARILAAAEELILLRGFKGVTMAEVADRAQVGKGTVYLYWKTKEGLFLDILARNIQEVLSGAAAQVRADAGLALPGDLCRLLTRSVLERPLVRALQTSDSDVLGALTADPRSQEMLREYGAAALIRTLLPMWRSHGLARTDWPAEQQAYALQTLVFGFLQGNSRPLLFEQISDEEKSRALAGAVNALLGAEEAAPRSAEDLASATIAVLTS